MSEQEPPRDEEERAPISGAHEAQADDTGSEPGNREERADATAASPSREDDARGVDTASEEEPPTEAASTSGDHETRGGDGNGSDDALDLDDVDVKDLLRAALDAPDPDEERVKRRVQDRIREDTQGRYYADGWSTSKAPKETFLITGVVMLVIVVVVWLLLGPSRFDVLR